jgi:hypothetical protein
MPDASPHCKRSPVELGGVLPTTRATCCDIKTHLGDSGRRTLAGQPRHHGACRVIQTTPRRAPGTATIRLAAAMVGFEVVSLTAARSAFLPSAPHFTDHCRAKLRSACHNKSLLSCAHTATQPPHRLGRERPASNAKHEQADQARPNRQQPRLISRYVATRKSVRRLAAAPTIQRWASA